MRSAFAASLLLLAAPAAAADLAATSRIDAVTVYPDAATVTRIVDIDAPAGETTLVLGDFPAGFDTASLRLDAAGLPGTAVSGVDANDILIDTPAPDASFEEARRALADKRGGVEAELDALKAKKGFIERVARSADLTPGPGSPAAPLDAAGLRAAWTAVGDDLKQANLAIKDAEGRIRAIDRDIARLEAQHIGRGQGEHRTQLRVAMTAGAATHGRLAISYILRGASWTPLYDARLDSAKGTLEIVRRASISQSTGEDWTDVALTVSTARAAAGARAPRLDPVILRPLALADAVPRPLLAAPRRFKSSAADEVQAAEAPAPVAPAAAEPAPPPPGVEQEAKTQQGAFQASWTVEGRTSIPSGPTTKSLRLASHSVTPTLVARAAPSQDPTAFLEAAFDHDEDVPLLAGRVAVTRDGFYAGEAPMPQATRGEPVRIGFGADDRIRVERAVTRRRESDAGPRGTNGDRREFRITLRNGRPAPMRLSVEEALPVSENADIKVEMLPSTTPPTERNADNRRGILVWTADLAAGEVKEIKFGYRVTWPAGTEIDLE